MEGSAFSVAGTGNNDTTVWLTMVCEFFVLSHLSFAALSAVVFALLTTAKPMLGTM